MALQLGIYPQLGLDLEHHTEHLLFLYRITKGITDHEPLNLEDMELNQHACRINGC